MKSTRRKYFTAFIEKLKIKEEKQLEKEQNEATEFQLGGKTQSFTSNFDDNSSTKFYFYNQRWKK